MHAAAIWGSTHLVGRDHQVLQALIAQGVQQRHGLGRAEGQVVARHALAAGRRARAPGLPGSVRPGWRAGRPAPPRRRGQERRRPGRAARPGLRRRPRSSPPRPGPPTPGSSRRSRGELADGDQTGGPPDRPTARGGAAPTSRGVLSGECCPPPPRMNSCDAPSWARRTVRVQICAPSSVVREGSAAGARRATRGTFFTPSRPRSRRATARRRLPRSDAERREAPHRSPPRRAPRRSVLPGRARCRPTRPRPAPE